MATNNLSLLGLGGLRGEGGWESKRGEGSRPIFTFSKARKRLGKVFEKVGNVLIKT